MKRIILTAVFLISFAVLSSAQPRAFGIRAGNNYEISYQHTLGNNFLEVDGGCGIGFDGVFNAGATGIYNFLISEFGNGFGFYAGPGASIGLEEESLFTISAAGMVGLEYTLFELPIQFSLDFRQHIGIRVNGSGLWTPSSICLGVRYLFW